MFIGLILTNIFWGASGVAVKVALTVDADDAALDAAIIAMQVPEKCIRVQWRREEEFGFEPVSTAPT